MRRDKIEVLADSVDRLRAEFEAMLSAVTHAADHACGFEHAEVLADGLPGKPRASRQLRNRARRAGGKTCYES